MEKTKIIKIVTIVWMVTAGLYEANVLDFLPEVNNWLKLIVAVSLLVLNYLNGKEVMAKSIGGGGIKNDKPNP